MLLLTKKTNQPVDKNKVSEVNAWLRSIGERFKYEASDVINSTYVDNKLAKSIANSVSIVPYAVTPSHMGFDSADYMLMQPSVQMQISPYVSSFDKACQVANHQLDLDKAYTPEIIANAKELYDTYNVDSDLSFEDMCALQNKTLETIERALPEGPGGRGWGD